MAFAPISDKSTGDILTAANYNLIANNFDEVGVALVTAKGDLTPASGNKALIRLAVGVKGNYLAPAAAAPSGLQWQTPYSAILVKGIAQSIPDATSTAITFNATDGPGSTASEVHDPSNMHNNVTQNSRITVPVGAGALYMIGGFANFAANTGGDQRYISIAVNGTEYILQGQTATPANAVVRLALNVPQILSAGDWVELKVYQNRGGALNVTNAGLWMIWQNNFGL